MNSRWRWRCMQRPITVPSSTLSAANRVVVPCRLSSCVMVWQRPGLIGNPGWVRSSAWIWLFSSIDSTAAWAGGVDIEPDDISQLGGKARIARALEGAQPMRLQFVRPPDALH